MRVILASAVLLMMCSLSPAQEQIAKSFTLGDLAYLEAAEPCGWICFDRQVSAERDGQRCYIQLEKIGTFKVAALSKKNVGDVVAYYTVTVTGSPQPVPPGPQPVPPGPVPPPPTPVPPDSWQSRVEAMTRKLGSADLAIAPQVSKSFSELAARCGRDLFTGPEIRAALDAKLTAISGYPMWSSWNREWFEATAVWAGEKYRDAAAYRERLEQTVKGINAVVPAPQQITLAAPIEGVRVSLIANRHQIRGGKLFEYRCPQNGRRCSWVEVGRVLEQGRGWVIVQ